MSADFSPATQAAGPLSASASQKSSGTGLTPLNHAVRSAPDTIVDSAMVPFDDRTEAGRRATRDHVRGRRTGRHRPSARNHIV